MAGGNKKIKPEDGKQFSSEYQPQEKWTENKSIELGQELIDWLKQKENIFFEEFLVIEKDLYPELIGYLTKKFSSFFKLISKAKKIQEIKLIKFGVADELNSTMTKFVLTNHHDYSDRKEVNLKQDKPLTNITITEV
jgi:hypothetical protein